MAGSYKTISVRPKNLSMEGRSRLTTRVATGRIKRMNLFTSIKAEAADQIASYKGLSARKVVHDPRVTCLRHVLTLLTAHPPRSPFLA